MRNDELDKCGPKLAEHPSVGKPCPACDVPFNEGDITTLITLGPGKDDDSRRRAQRGLSYNAVTVEVHWSCATGEEEP